MEPVFNFGGSAILSVLVFLGTAGLLGMAGVGFTVLALTGRWRAARWVGMSAAGIGAGYLAVLAGVSLTSRARAVDVGGEKYFCELDCHLAYSVVGSRRVAELPTDVPGVHEDRVWEVVTVRVRFDERTVSPRRGDAPLYPKPREVRLAAANGHVYPQSEGAQLLEAAGGDATTLDRPLRPGESYTATLVFDLPADAGRTELVLVERDPVTRLLIGHENSLFHRPTAFRLAEGRRP